MSQKTCARRHYLKYRTRILAKCKEYRQQNKEKLKLKSFHYSFKKYGLTLEEYNQMYNKQSGKCAICQVWYPRLDIDHDHKEGRVRALLCMTCNRFVVNVLENYTDKILLAQNYLKQWGIVANSDGTELIQ